MNKYVNNQKANDKASKETAANIEALKVKLKKRGNVQGYLSESDISTIVEQTNLTDQQISELFDYLSKQDFEFQLGEEVKEEKQVKQGEKKPHSGQDIAASSDSLKLYFNEIAKYPLLSANEEIALASQIKKGKEASKRLKANEELKGDEFLVFEADEAKDILTNSNLRLVVSIAKRYIGRGLPLLDLIQEGNVGLMKAVDKFDHTLGYRFSTYASWWISQSMIRAIANQAQTIRIPVHMIETINKINKVEKELTQELGAKPSEKQLSEKLGPPYSVEKIREINQLTSKPLSLQTKVGDDNKTEIGELLEDIEEISPAEHTSKQTQIEQLYEMMAKCLTKREDEIIRLRYGLDDNKARTLEEIGQIYGLTRERIRQIQAKALRKMRFNEQN